VSSTATSIVVLVGCTGIGLALGTRLFPLRDSVPPLTTWISRVVFVAALVIAGADAFNLGNELKHFSSTSQFGEPDRGNVIAGQIERLALRVAPLLAVAVFIELFARGKIERSEPLQPASNDWDSDAGQGPT
jgi:hypothetical protein